MKSCELCPGTARMFCASDQAILCFDCDAEVHGANFLVARHSRVLLCRSCQSPTPWKAAGSRLGPTVSVCDLCVAGKKVEDEGESRERERVDDDDDGDGDNGDEMDEESDDEEEEEQGEEQVVPWSTETSPPPVASSSSSEEEESSSSVMKRMRQNVDLSSPSHYSQDQLPYSSSSSQHKSLDLV